VIVKNDAWCSLKLQKTLHPNNRRFQVARLGPSGSISGVKGLEGSLEGSTAGENTKEVKKKPPSHRRESVEISSEFHEKEELKDLDMPND
jgi:hypothetical protein